jgi:hypothetical protein
MKRILISTLLLFSFAIAGFSQNDAAKAEAGRLQAYKIAYLTRKLNLTPEEAERFWPVYNKYQDEIRNTRIADRQANKREIDTEEKILNIRKKYNSSFEKALTPEKVDKLYQSEKEFGNMVQKELYERRQQKMNNRKRND